MSKAALLLAFLAAAAVSAAADLDEAVRSITAHEIRAHIAFLSHDLLEGRAPGTRGADLAAQYIATQLASAGVRPVGTSYLQPVPLVGWRTDHGTTEIDARTQDGAAERLRNGSDVILWSGAASDARLSAELVFVGYGTRAEEFAWDDFKGRDLRGRVLLMLVGDPPAPPTDPFLFDGRALTYYGRWTYKLEEARRQGAAGVLLVHDTDRAGFDWPVVRASWGGEVLSLAPRPGVAETRLPFEGWISRDATARTLAAAGLSLPELLAFAARRDFAPIATGIRIEGRIAGTMRRVRAANVAGIVPGSDPQRRDEFVIVAAHYDHLGIGPPIRGDSIYSGAYDNASGVAALLEIAQAFAMLDPAPSRSILLLATTAEEAGLLGATHYTRSPLVPLERTVAMINLDGVNLWGETDDVTVIGAERSALGRFAATRAAQLGLRAQPEPTPERGLFFRSDNFAFARAGVPAIRIDHGTIFRRRPADWGIRVLTTFENDHYHRPSDRLDPEADLAGAVQQAAFAFLVGYDIAQAAVVPRWVVDDGFRAASFNFE